MTGPTDDTRLHSVALEQDFETREADGDLVIEGYGLHWESPTYLYRLGLTKIYEQVAKGAWDDEAIERTVYLQGHQWSGHVFASVPGSTLVVSEDDTGLVVSARLDARQQRARDLWTSVARGDVAGQSVGFSVGVGFKETKEEIEDDKMLYTITKSPRLFEVSAVWNPAYKSSTLGVRQQEKRMALRGEGGDATLQQAEQDQQDPQWKRHLHQRIAVQRARIADADKARRQ